MKHTSTKHKTSTYIFIFLFGFLLYANTINHDYVLDDKPAIEENRLVKNGLAGIPLIITKSYRFGNNKINEGLYRPLSLVTFAVEYQFFGKSSRVGHFVNVLLYAFCGILLFQVLYRTFKDFNFLLPFITTLLFIAHPVHTEVVANIKSRDEILSFLGFLLSIHFLIKYHEHKHIKFLIFASTSYLMSLLSKESAITFLAVYPLYLFFFNSTGLNENFKISSVFFITAAVYLIMMFSFIDKIEGGKNVDIIQNSLGAATNTLDHYATAIFILGKYLWLIFFPITLTYDYSYNQIPIVTFFDFKTIASVIIFLVLFVYSIIKIPKKDILAFGILFFLITISLVSNLVFTIEWTLGERFLFTPSFGLCLMLAFIILKILKIDITNKTSVFPQKISLIIVLSVILIFYSYKTISRNTFWKNNFTLFSNDVHISTNSARVHGHLGKELVRLAKEEISQTKKIKLLNEALKEYKISIGIYPKYYDVVNEIGVTYFEYGKVEEAMSYYKKAILLNPEFTEAYHNLGVAYTSQKKYNPAIESYLKALQYDSLYVKSIINVANEYYQIKEFQNAVKYCKKAIEIEPENKRLYQNLYLMYKAKGDIKNAEFYLRKSIKIK